jgi:hypothetical protein
MYLASAGSRLHHRALGIAAACGLFPNALAILLNLAYQVSHLSGMNATFSANLAFAKIAARGYMFNHAWLILFWSAIALCAAILALRQPR